MTECDVVIPCRNEAPALPELLARMPEAFRAIVVDNGSTDDTADAARTAGATVVTESTPGYGAAVHAGVCAATADYVAVIDGDGSMDPSDLADLLADVRGDVATMAAGRRRAVGAGVWPWHARAGTALLAWLIRRRTRLAIHDLAPMRVCRREDLVTLGVRDRRFGYPLELMMLAARAGWTVRERDIAYTRRAPGTRSKVSGSVRGTALTMVDFAGVLRQVGR
ncbi:glycosyltransferase family 2 protein [Solicola gregarius]|uniref:Glycosyltransferase family 2 protein n=1 Tax=Solicola gregarius TaxID=2908642 RepID=A0AA46THE3_9ACTN|nr:glycosyltransferase family 2 protein [Solicola gregarius]UYM04553.1 glycosyltransferase family 2 protein [Solicola gregarius]